MTVMTAPKVTVAICTLNREEVLRQLIEDILAQHYQPLELLIIDQTPVLSPEMERYYHQHPQQLTLVRMKAQGQGQARNLALRQATGEIILYFDDDVRLEPKIIEYHAQHYQDPMVGAVTGRIDDAKGDPPSCGGRVNWYGKVTVDRFIGRTHHVESVSGGNMSVRTALLRQLGGFWELAGNTVQMREETDMSLKVIKAGYQVICEPAAHLLHLAYPSGGTRTETDRIRWYEDYFYAEFTFFFRHFAKWKLPIYLLSLTRPITACAIYYGHFRGRALMAPWRGLARAWQ